MTNEELIQKAITAAETFATYGKLNPAQSDKFIDYVIDETVLKDNVRVVRFRNEELTIDKIGIGKRVMFPATEYVAPSIRLGVVPSKITLKPQEVITAFDISDAAKEITLEGDSFEDHVIKMFATGWGNDQEQLVLNADAIGPAVIEGDILPGGSQTRYIKDDLMGMVDGWSRLADGSHLVNAGNVSVGLNVFSAMIRAMPQKFRRNKSQLRFFMASDLAQIYIEKIATRMTPKGDAATEGQIQTPFGIPIVEVPLMDLLPKVTENVTMTGVVAQSLRYAPYSAEIVTPSDLAAVPTVPYVKDTDYSVDYTSGTITRIATGAITDAQVVKVTYSSNPQILLTHWQNFILAIGRDIRIERQRNIHKRANEYVVTGKIDCQIEELDAAVKAYNVGANV